MSDQRLTVDSDTPKWRAAWDVLRPSRLERVVVLGMPTRIPNTAVSCACVVGLCSFGARSRAGR